MSSKEKNRPPEESKPETQEMGGLTLEARRAIETVGAGAVREAAEIVHSIEELVEDREFISDKKNKEIIRKIVRGSVAFAQRLVKISALVALGLTANYFRTKENVDETLDTNNGIVYVHPDEETTHILNYLSGRESLTGEERLRFLRMIAREFAAARGKPVPRDMDAMSLAEVRDYLIQNFSGGSIEAGREAEDLIGFPNSVPNHYVYDRDTYDSVWAIEKEVGAPRVRWITGSSRNPPNEIIKPGYSVLTNTIYIRPTHPLMNLAYELPHADQYRNRPVWYYLRQVEEYLRIVSKTITRLQSPGSMTDEEYNAVPGSIENEAHNKIQPEIRRRMGLDDSEEKAR